MIHIISVHHDGTVHIYEGGEGDTESRVRSNYTKDKPLLVAQYGSVLWDGVFDGEPIMRRSTYENIKDN